DAPPASSLAKKRNPLTAITILLAVTTLASIGLCFYILSIKSDTPAISNEVVASDNSVLYTQEMLDQMMLEARAEGAAEQESQIKEFIRSQLESPEGNVSEILRQMYPESVIYYDSQGYHFVSILDSIAPNTINTEQLSVLESGEITYLSTEGVQALKGVDVSQHQGAIDWEAVADSGVDYAMIRVGFRGYGSGALVLDECFEANITSARAAGLEVGVYFFTQAITIAEAQEEAQFVLDAIAPYQLSYPIVIDIEKPEDSEARAMSLSVVDRTSIVKAFCDSITAAGYEPMLYGNTYSFFAMVDIEQLCDYPIWYAFYNDYPYYPYALRSWQYTAQGTIPGIDGPADLNLWFPE
ncbi:MAG TPA: glycoside hydrolase family 25 protein, partial [Lachnospiraceae bacterium]|nr:glycoside hydrolase family 25 protein [Lachnospiraceae bacterium]